MKKIIVEPNKYLFNPTQKEIILADDYKEYLIKEHLLLITNTSTNEIIYNFGCDGYGGTINDLQNKITLEYNTTLMDEDDNLQIILYSKLDAADDLTITILKEISSNTRSLNNVIELLTIQNELIKNLF